MGARVPPDLRTGALIVALLVAAACGAGGGGGGAGGGVEFDGEVAGVTPAPTSAATPTPAASPTPTASRTPTSSDATPSATAAAATPTGTPTATATATPILPIFGFRLGVARAFADSCPAVHVLACAEPGPEPTATPTSILAPLTPSPSPAFQPSPRPTPTPSCSDVDEGTCTFHTEARASSIGGISVFFVDDTNGDGGADDDETRATLSNDLGTACNGSAYRLNHVVIDFASGSARATVTPERNGCTPTPAATATSSGTNPTPTPTRSCGMPGTPCSSFFQCCSFDCVNGLICG